MSDSEMIIKGEGKQPGPDRMAGFFASVVAALIISGLLVRPTLFLLGALFAFEASPNFIRNLTSALFLGVVLADPVGAWLRKRSLKRTIAKACIGISLGGFLQHYLVTPIAGTAVSQMIFLLLTLALLPILIGMQALERMLLKRGIVVSEILARGLIFLVRSPWPVPATIALVLTWLGFRAVNMPLTSTLVLFVGALYLLFSRALRAPVIEDGAPDEEAAPHDPGEAPRQFASYFDLAMFELRQFIGITGPSVLLLASLAWGAWAHFATLVPLVGALPAPLTALLGLVAGFAAAAGYGVAMLALAGLLGRWPRGDLGIRAHYLVRMMTTRS